MLLISYEQWQQWSSEYTALPLVAVFPIEQARPHTWKTVWEQAKGPVFVLESGKTGRYHFVGLDPVSMIHGKGLEGQIIDEQGSSIEVQGHPLALVQQWMSPYKSPKVKGLPKFIGGCVGYWGYDVARSLERLPETAEDDLALPDYCLMRFERMWVIDTEESQLYCAIHLMNADIDGSDPDRLKNKYEQLSEQLHGMKQLWDRLTEQAHQQEDNFQREQKQRLADRTVMTNVETLENLKRSLTRDQFVEAVKKIQQYIAAGDVFQVNLSVRQSRPLTAAPEDIYEWLRLVNPSPYMGYLNFGDYQIVSASPELLVQLDGEELRTRPIAGTRPRGSTDEEDLALAQELIDNEKERAEHIMLIDLERNDMGKVCRYGTVKVTELMAIERYSHVMHIVSEVTGQLDEGLDAFDVIAATFPGGTITGAPKVRTMEIIEELEPVRRGPYTGSIGWIDYNGNMELNIVIRTLVTVGGQGHVQAGAGIVIDSDPEKEYIESLNKAKALWKAIQLAEGESF